jgi:hypothetical protein
MILENKQVKENCTLKTHQFHLRGAVNARSRAD